MSLSLAGVTLHVADVERSLAFYTQIPGVEVLVHRPNDFALLRIGGGRLGLLRHNAGQFHIEIDTPDLDAAYEQLRAAGLATKGGPVDRPWGERDLLIRDPDGYMVEFN